VRKLQHILLLTGLAMACLFLFSCKDLKKNYTVKGRLLHSCDNPVPVKDFKVDLYNTHHRCEGVIQSAYTNADGNFILDYDATCSDNSSWLLLQYDVSFSSAALVEKIHTNKNEDIGDIYLKDNGFYVIKIKTNHSYTSSDTLFYNITNLGSKYKIGPFNDNAVIDTLFQTVFKSQKSEPKTSVNSSLSWVLKSGSAIHHIKYLGNGQQFYIEPCKKYSEVVLDISK